MQLTFDMMAEGDEEAFHRTMDDLSEGLEGWIEASMEATAVDPDQVDVDLHVAHARMGLEFKGYYGDGRLVDWSPADVLEFLLDWCPRKVMAPPDLAAAIPVGLGMLFAYLDQHGLLVGGTTRSTRLLRVIDESLGAFMDAMADDSKFGMGKSIFASLGIDDIEGLDEGDIADLMNRFNALPDEERFAALGGGPGSGGGALPFGPPPSPVLPAVVLPDREMAATQAATAPMIGQLRALADFCGDGRKLTGKGNLTLADARQLVELAGTGDQLDPDIGGKVFKTKSAEDLYGLQRLFTVGKKAGVVRIQHGKVLCTKRGATFGDDPLVSLERGLDALVEIGPIRAGRPDREYFMAVLDELADESTFDMIGLLYARQAPVAIEAVADLLAEELLDELDIEASSYWNDDRIGEHAVVLVDRIVDVLAWAGAVVREGGEPDPRSGRVRGGRAALTPAGVIAVRNILTAAGITAPAAEPQWSDATAEELLDRLVETDDIETCITESAGWRARRSPDAAAEAIAASATAGDGERCVFAFQILRDIGTDIAGPFVAPLEQADLPAARGLARASRAQAEGLLDDAGVAPARYASPGPQGGAAAAAADAVAAATARLAEILAPADHAAFGVILADRLLANDTVGAAWLLDRLLPPEGQLALVSTIWRSTDPTTALVLDAVGVLTTDKKVAKAARKAAMQHQSHLANQP